MNIITYDGVIMTDLKIDYNVIYSQVKVYEKKYKRKDKNGNPVTATTVQNTILLPKKIPFKSDEDVVIMKEKTFQDLTKDTNYNTNDLKKKLEDKDNEIKNLKETIATLESQSINQENTTINTLVEELTISNHKNQELQQQLQQVAIEITRYDEKLSKNKQLFNLINRYYEKLLKDAIDTSVDATIVEINKELKQTNFIQRLKGLKIVSKPSIDDDKIVKNMIEELDDVINDNALLE